MWVNIRSNTIAGYPLLCDILVYLVNTNVQTVFMLPNVIAPLSTKFVRK